MPIKRIPADQSGSLFFIGEYVINGGLKNERDF